MLRKLKEKVRLTAIKAAGAVQNPNGEFYVDKVIGIIIAVVIGGLLLTGLYALFNNTVLPGLTDKIQNLFK